MAIKINPGPGVRALNPHIYGESTERVIDSSQGVSEEEILHNEIIDYCKDRRWLYFHGSMAHATKRTLGEPDFTILTEKGVFFVECKTKTGKVSVNQRDVIHWARSLGITIHVVCNMKQFRAIVE